MRTAVLLMAYGSPRTPDEIEPYFTDIRGGRPPSPQVLKVLADRYERIGGKSPLNEITREQAESLEELLEHEHPGDFAVFTGMKHWHPFVADSVAKIVDAGITRVIGLVLAPHFSKKSIGEYEARILKARDALGADLRLTMVKSWYDEPAFVDLVAENLKQSLNGWDASSPDTCVFFTAHSIPARIVAEGDPYADQLSDSAKVYAEAAGISNYTTGWQSESTTGEPWLGPDILVRLGTFAEQGGRRALIAPVGFVADHLEVLFDVDVECAERAAELGIELRRIPSPNADPRFVRALSDIVMRYSDPS
ncbi:MAG TPA: ferrochelatase [Actinomycetota bacterium]|nr:ferrochelatase [Actinomycetota bacterium]